jgi:hypothetical protein
VTASIPLTRNSHVHLTCENQTMFRRRCGAVIDEDYVQEHILTVVMSRRWKRLAEALEDARPLRSALSLHTNFKIARLDCDAQINAPPATVTFDGRRIVSVTCRQSFGV